jgi:hypothetical protein
MGYDLKLDTDGDLAFSADGDLVLNEGLEAIAQDIRARLLFFKGEWFLDQDIGLPYFEDILVKNPSILGVMASIRSEIQNTPGVNEITKLEPTFDRANRKLSVTWAVTSDLGEIGETTGL